jgi:hypothetical protein
MAQENLPNGHKIYVPTSSITRPSKVFTNCYFWFQMHIPSGNPGLQLRQMTDGQIVVTKLQSGQIAATEKWQLLDLGCQIFPGTIYQNGKKYTKRPQYIPNYHEIHQTAIKYTKWQ